jgi:hypothetical protein
MSAARERARHRTLTIVTRIAGQFTSRPRVGKHPRQPAASKQPRESLPIFLSSEPPPAVEIAQNPPSVPLRALFAGGGQVSALP